MTARDPGESHRVATPLELLFDLCFVVAVAQAASRLHHHLVEGHVGSALVAYLIVFFAIWWAWMNFTWFASAYDTDDVPYRLKVFVQIVGVLVVAAGVPRAFDAGDFRVVTAGYCLMRVGLVAQWLRAARADPPHRQTALRYALGLVACQVGWLVLLAFPREAWLLGWLVLAPAELAVPIWAERARVTSWHPHHIAERYGLFTLIVLGESVLATTRVIQEALDSGHGSSELVGVIVGAVLILVSMWWLYFDREEHHVECSRRTPFLWGYGHWIIFASTAAVGAGLGVATDFATGRAHGAAILPGAAVAVPVALYVLAGWMLEVRPMESRAAMRFAWPVAAVLILVAPVSAAPVPTTGIVLVVLTAFSVTASPLVRPQLTWRSRPSQ